MEFEIASLGMVEIIMLRPDTQESGMVYDISSLGKILVYKILPVLRFYHFLTSVMGRILVHVF